MAWMGMLGEEGRLRKELLYVLRGIASVLKGEGIYEGGWVNYRSILAGTYPPPPMAIMRLG